jgi:hypothetical protein
MRPEKRGQGACFPWNQSQLGICGAEYVSRRVLSLSRGQAWGMSRRFAVVGFQQSTQTLDTDDLTLVPFMLRCDDPAEPLVNPLMMIVLKVLG